MTSGDDHSVVTISAKTYTFLKRIPAAEDADAIVYNPASMHVFSLNGDANNTTVIDANSGNVIKNLPLGGKPEYDAVDGAGKLFVNLEDKKRDRRDRHGKGTGFASLAYWRVCGARGHGYRQ